MSGSSHPGNKRMSPLGQAMFFFFAAYQECAATSPDSTARTARWKNVVATHKRLLLLWEQVRRRAMDHPDHFPHTVLEEFGTKLSDWASDMLTWRTAGGFNRPPAASMSMEEMVAKSAACRRTEEKLKKTLHVLIKEAWGIEDRLDHVRAGRSKGRNPKKKRKQGNRKPRTEPNANDLKICAAIQNEGSQRAAAKSLGLKSHGHFGKSIKLVEEALKAKGRSVSTRKLPEDKRGNATIADG